MSIIKGQTPKEALKVDADVDVDDPRFDADGYLAGVRWVYGFVLERGN